MGTDRVSDKGKISYSQGHELLNVFIKAGLNPERAQEIINAPGNRLAMIAMHAVFGNDVQNAPAIRVPSETDLLEYVTTVIIGGDSTFSAKEKFITNIGDDATVKIANICASFDNRFLRRVIPETPVIESAVRCHRLRRAASNLEIISFLGGKLASEVTLTEVFTLVERQGIGQPGVLLVDDWWNVFFVRDSHGELFAVGARMNEKGWQITSTSIKGTSGWGANIQVFSRGKVSCGTTRSFLGPERNLSSRNGR